MLREVKTSQRLPRMLAIKVDGVAPAILVGKFDATLTDNGIGDYTLTLAKPLPAFLWLLHAQQLLMLTAK